jgi:Kef-type K+ transport system membrane component KefB
VLGLLVLAVVGSVLAAVDAGRDASYLSTLPVLGKALAFLSGAIGLGVVVVPRLFSAAAWLRGQGVLLTTALVLCFILAYSASAVGLAPIVGAYAAGLVLEEVHFKGFARQGERPLAELVRPLASLLAPVFFVVMGLRVDLGALGHPEVLALAAGLTVAAILGKQACALGAWNSSLDRLSIGLGMIPRGEVGLIFANLGLGLVVRGERIMDQAAYSAVVLMIMATTLVTPLALKWSIAASVRRGCSTPESLEVGDQRPAAF